MNDLTISQQKSIKMLGDIPPREILPYLDTPDRIEQFWGAKDFANLFSIYLEKYLKGQTSELNHCLDELEIAPDLKLSIEALFSSFTAFYSLIQARWNPIKLELEKTEIEAPDTPGEALVLTVEEVLLELINISFEQRAVVSPRNFYNDRVQINRYIRDLDKKGEVKVPIEHAMSVINTVEGAAYGDANSFSNQCLNAAKKLSKKDAMLKSLLVRFLIAKRTYYELSKSCCHSSKRRTGHTWSDGERTPNRQSS